MTYTDYISWLIFFCEMKGSHCNMESSPLLGQQDCGESNMAVEGDDSCLSIKPVPRYSQSIGSTIRFDCEARSNTMSEAKFGYCPVQVCQLNGTWSTASLSCAKNECIETGKHYNGRRVCTKSGIPCQSWTSQVPHSHGFVYGDVFPDKTIEHAGRTCRDPGFLRGSPWCYTQDNNIEWDFCDIPKCQDVPVNEIPCSEGQNEQTDCGIPDFQLRADNECVSLAPLDTFETTEGSALIYKCAKLQEGVISFNNYCPVEVCQANGTWSPAYVSCAENECYVGGKSREYKGKRICTSNGLQCKPWNELKDKTFYLHSFSDETIQSAGSYCRDPDGERGSPWCYTDNVLWDYCSVPKCSDILTEEFICRETEATTVTIPSNMLDTTVIYAPRLEIENNQPVDQEFITYVTKIVDDKKVTRPDNLEQSTFYTTASPTTNAQDMYSANWFATDKIQTNDDLPHQLQTAETTKVVESSKTGWHVETGEKYQTKELVETSKQLTTFPRKDETEYFQISSALDTTTATSQMTKKTAGAQVQTNGIKYKTKPAHISEATDISKDETKPAHISEATDVSKDETKPAHISEATDVSKDETKPVHISEATDVSKDETEPDHISEATYISEDETKKAHISEATDVLKDETKPAHISEATDISKDETKPAHISEATDVSKDETKPAHISEATDVSKDETKPSLISGATDVSKDETKPVQISEATDVSKDETKPDHISEATDISEDETKKAHISKATDVLKDETKPAHISEATDVSKDETKPAHISESTDVSKDETKPGQISEGTDVSKDETKSGQISEATDVSKDETKPAHISEATDISNDEIKPAHISEATDVLKDETKLAHISEANDVSKDETKPAHISEATDISKDETKPAHISESTDVSKDETKPGQISEGTDVSKDETKPGQISEATDVSKDETKPAHISEATDISEDETKKAHISEVTDVSKDETKPAHISEATDVSNDETKPAHISEATDISKDETKPAHISESTDVSKDETKPGQISEGTDVSKDETKPGQISEATDVSKDETKPAHISEATDISNDETKPAHISQATDISKDETKPAHISEATDVSKDEIKPAHISEATDVLKDETKPAHISDAADISKDETKPAHISEATDVSKDETKPAHISETSDGSKDETRPVHISEASDVSKDETGTSTNITGLEQLMTTKINEASENSQINKVTKDLISVQSATVDNIQTVHSTKYSPDHDLTTLGEDIDTMRIKVGRTEHPIFFISQSIKGTPTNKAVERTYKYLSKGTEQTEPKIEMYTEVPESMHTITDDISSKTTAPIDGLLHTTEMIEMVKHIKQDTTTDQVIDSDQHTFKENIINHTNDNNEQTTALYDRIVSVSAMTYNNNLGDESSKEARTFPLLDGNIANDANDTHVDYEHGSSVNERQRDSVNANAQAVTIQKYELGDTSRNTMSSSHFVSTIDDPITKQIETNSNNQHKIEASTDNIWTRQSIDNNRVHMASSSSSHEDTTPESKPKLERPIDKAITFNSTTNIKSKPYKSETASNNFIKCQTGSVLFTQFRKSAVQSHQIQRVLSRSNILDCARICRSNSDCVLFRYLADECTIFGSDYMGGGTIDCSSGQSCYRRIN